MNALFTPNRPTRHSRQPSTRKQDNLDKILSSIRSGNCCRVLGPRFRCKSVLMREAATSLHQSGTHYVSYQSLSDVQADSGSSFFASLYAGIEKEFLFQNTEGLGPPDSAFEFQRALLGLVRKSDRNLALFVDDLEMAPPNRVAALLGALRAVFMTVIDQPGARFQAVVCGSLSFNQVALDNASRFESISDLVLVGDLDEEERFVLARTLCQEAGLTPMTAGLEALLEQTGGDRFLIERVSEICFDIIEQTGKARLTPKRVAEAVVMLLLLQWDWQVVEVLKQIESNPNLLSCALRILNQGEVHSAQLPIDMNETPTLLDLCGIFSRSGDHYRIKCELWSQLLYKHLTAAHVGGLYAIAGYWSESLKHFGQAMREGQPRIKSELFTATINAVHASENVLQAFGYLAQGLQAAYPGSGLGLYYRRGEILELVYPFERGGERGAIFLDDVRFSEAKALRGPDYSIISVDQHTRLLIPLRVGGVHTRPIGLASFNKFVPLASPYQQREETLQLVGLLRQAAQAIDAKGQFATLLDTAERRASKLNALNSILTRILHHPERPEETILRLVLAGVTSRWGLEFNRAVLFMPDENQQNLTCRLGVGHLTQKQAQADSETSFYQELDDLIDDLLAGRGQETPLHQKIAHLTVPLEPVQTNSLVESFRVREPLFSSRHRTLTEDLPQAFHQAIAPPREFALVPLNAVDHALGVLYVDNKFTKRTITDEHFELLQVFVNQAALILENVQALAVEKERTATLTELLQVEERVNDHITKSIQELLDEIVHSACRLIGADCAVLYPLRPDLAPQAYFYEIEHIAYSGTRQKITPTDKARSPDGMAAWVIREGLVHESNVKTASPSPYGRKMSDSPFISRENIQAFVGVRLGPIDEPVGILYVNWRSPRPLTEEELTFVKVYANFVAVTIPSARRYQQVEADLKRRTQELHGMSQVFYASLAFRSEEAVEEAIKQTLKTAWELTKAHYAHLIRNEPHGRWQVFWLTSSGKLQSNQLDAIQGISRRAFVEAASCLVVNAGPLGTRELSNRHHPDSRSGLAIPVKVTGHCQAVLYLESPEPYGLNIFYQEFLEHLVSRLAFTLEQAELYQALRRLLDISLQLTREPSLKVVLVSVVEQAMGALRAVDTITLYYVELESGRLVLGHMAGVHDESAVKRYPPYSRTVIDQVWKSDDPIFAENVARNRLLDGPFARREGIKSAAAFPLEAGEERVGCMFFNYRFDHSFDAGEKSVLNLFAQWAAFAILRATLYDEAERRRQRLETVARITPIISANLELDDVFRAVLSEVKQAVPRAQNACMVQLDEETQNLYISPANLEFYHVDEPPPQGPFQTSTSERRGISGRVIQTGQAAIVPDVHTDPDYISAIASTHSELCVPIRIDGKTQAALVLESDQLDAFTLDDKRLLEMLADHVAIAIQNVRQSELIRERELRERIAKLATGLIHDINSAVATIPDLVTEIEEKAQSGGDVNAPLVDLQKSAVVTGRISNRLRDFVITGQFNSELIRLEPLIQKAIDVARDLKPTHVSIQCQLEGLNPEIEADALWIELLVKNLILNAIDAIPPDQEGVVELTADVDPDNVFIHVADNGRGIAPENIARLFEPGYTTKEDRSRLHGIGLYHCLQVVQEHQGDLKVESKPGVGTTFTAILPLAPLLAVSGGE